MRTAEPVLSRTEKLWLPSVIALGGALSLSLGTVKSNQPLLIVGVISLQASAFLFSVAMVPIVTPAWSMVAGSFSGLAFSLPALILGGWALRLAGTHDMPVLRMLSYALLLLAAVSLIALVRLAASQKVRLGWYREMIEGCRKAREDDWCVAAGKAAIAAMAGKPEFDEMKASFHNQLGSAHFRRGEYEVAIAEYTKALEHQPVGRTALGVPGYKLAIAYSNRAEAHIALGDFPTAIEDCHRALQVDGSDQYAKDLIAEAKICRALRLDPAHPGAQSFRFLPVAQHGSREGLARLRGFTKDAVPQLVALMHDEDERVRWFVNETLRDVGRDAAEAVGALIVALRDPHAYCMYEVVQRSRSARSTTDHLRWWRRLRSASATRTRSCATSRLDPLEGSARRPVERLRT